jgi:hypothetical protein
MMARVSVACLVVAIASLAGCSGSGSSSDQVKIQLSHIRLLSNLYVRSAASLNHNPASEEEFKKAISDSGITPEMLKIDNIDQLFTSERDGQPLVVVYGPQPPGSDVIIYEATGVDGMRYVAHKIGQVEEVDEARFRELVPAAK